MEKKPIEIFVAEQMEDPRYQAIVTHMGVDRAVVQLSLVQYLRAQGICFVSPSLAAELKERIATELEQGDGVSGVAQKIIASIAKKTNR